MIARKAVRFGTGAVSHPVRTVRASGRHARQNPAPTVILIFGMLVALNYARTQTIPTAEQGIAWVGAALAIVIAAQIAPDVVTGSLLLVLLYFALTNAAFIEELVARLTGKLGSFTSAGPATAGRL